MTFVESAGVLPCWEHLGDEQKAQEEEEEEEEKQQQPAALNEEV